MLKLSIEKVLNLRNVTKPASFMKKSGTNYYTGKRYLTGSQRIVSLDTLEKICLQLHCTPNDLLEWIPENELPGHPLNQLASRDINALAEKLKRLPIDKIDALNNWLESQK